MSSGLWRTILNAIVAPAAAAREAGVAPEPLRSGVRLSAIIVALGAATLPRQLNLLASALAPTGDPVRDGHLLALASGLRRIVVLDRLVPPPTVLLAAALLLVAAEPALALAEEHRRRIRAIIILGLVPLVAQRVGELALTYAASAPAHLTPGYAVSLPQQFVTGPALIWAGDAPAWVEALSARLNLVTLWSVGIWSVGLRELDRQPFGAWHLVLPAACLGGAGLFTFWLGPLALSLVLGSAAP